MLVFGIFFREMCHCLTFNVAVDTVFDVKPEKRLLDLGEDAGVLTSVKDKARTRAGLRPSLTCVARAGLRGRRSGRRNDQLPIEQRNRK